MFRHPYALLALPLALALAWGAHALGARRRRTLTDALGDSATLRRLLRPEAEGRRRLQLWLRLGALAMLCLALAGPQWGVELVETHSQAQEVVIAVDVSLSMLAEDVRPNRLARAKEELALLIDELKGGRVGVLAFAGEPVVVCPLTTDAAAAKQLLRALEPGSAPVPGTGIGKALRRGTQMLARYPGARSLVLLTDGEDHHTDPLGGAELAAGEGVRVFTIGIGTPEGEPIPLKDASGAMSGYKKDKSGRAVVSRLGEKDLAAIAERTGGAYFRSTPGASEATEIAKRVAGGASTEEAAGATRRYKDRFMVPLALAFLLLLLEWILPEASAAPAAPRPAAAALGALLLLLLPAAPARAGVESSLRRGNKHYESERYTEALQSYMEAGRGAPRDARPAFNAGDALFKLEQFDKAADAFKAVAESGGSPQQRAAAYYNLGDALYKKEDYKGAVEAFRRAVALAPGDADARNNLAVALRKLKNPPPPKKQKQDDKKQPPPPPKPEDQKGGGGGGDQGQQPPPPTKTRPQDQLTKEDAERIMRAVNEREKASPKKLERNRGQKPPTEEDW